MCRDPPALVRRCPTVKCTLANCTFATALLRIPSDLTSPHAYATLGVSPPISILNLYFPSRPRDSRWLPVEVIPVATVDRPECARRSDRRARPHKVSTGSWRRYVGICLGGGMGG